MKALLLAALLAFAPLALGQSLGPRSLDAQPTESVDAKDRAGKAERERDAKARPKLGIDKRRTPPSVGSEAPGGAENALPSMGATPGSPSGSFGGSTPGRVKDPK